MKNFSIIAFKIIAILVGFISICLIGIIGIFIFLNSTNTLSPCALNILNRFVAGRMYCEDLQLNFTRFPIIGVKANNGYLISYLHKEPTDTLCRFKKLKAEINIRSFFDDSLTVTIPKAEVTDGFCLVTLDKKGTPGWNVWRFKKPKPANAPHHGHKEKLYLNEVHLYGHNHFVYVNHRRNRSMDISADNVTMHGQIRIKYRQIYINQFHATNIKSVISLKGGDSKIAFTSPEITIHSVRNKNVRDYRILAQTYNTFLKLFGVQIFDGMHKVRINLHAGLNPFDPEVDAKSIKINVDQSTSLEFMGYFNGEKDSVNMALSVATPNLKRSIKELKVKVPNKFQKLDYQLPLKIQAFTKGKIIFKKKIYPIINFILTSQDGNIGIDRYGRVNNIKLLANTSFDYLAPESTLIIIKNLDLDYRSSHANIEGILRFRDKNPIASISMGCKVHLKDINSFISKKMKIEGEMTGKAHIIFPIKHPDFFDGSNVDLMDKIKFRGLTFTIPQTRAKVSVPYATLNVTDLPGKNSINVKIVAPKSIIHSPDEAKINLGNLYLTTDVNSAKNALFPTLTNGLAILNNIRTISPHNDTISLKSFKSQFSAVSPRGDDPNINYMAMLEKLVYSNPDSACVFVNEIGIGSKAKMYEWVKVSPNTFYKLWDIIGNWEYVGELRLNNMYYTMPQFPILNSIKHLDLSFSQYSAAVNSLQMRLGNSDVSGEIKVDNWHNYIFCDSLLTVNGNVEVKKININTLLPVIISGVAYTQQQNKVKAPKKFAQVPSNLNINLNVNARNAFYENGRMDSAQANLLLNNQKLTVNNMKVWSNLANLDVNFSYYTPQSSFAYADLGLKVNDINPLQIIELLPQAKSISPFLTSFEGYFDASLDAKWKIDSTMMIMPSSLVSNAEIYGHNLSIDKGKILPKFLGWFFFGKDEKLHIDSIGAKIFLKDNILRVPTLSFNLNKYKLSAQGLVQNDSLMFYHIAMLKSPIGLKFGFDIYGIPAHFKYRLTGTRSRRFEDMEKKLHHYKFNDNVFPYRNSPHNATIMPIYQIGDNLSLSYKELKRIIDNQPPLTHEYILKQEDLMRRQIINKKYIEKPNKKGHFHLPRKK